MTTELDKTTVAAQRPQTAAPPSRARTRPAWRTLASAWAEPTSTNEWNFGPTQLERLRPRDHATDRNSDAEYAFYRLHGRFQRYAEELLFATERILAFVPWTAAATDTWWRRLNRWMTPGGRQAPEGVLVVTDRQVLFLHDDAEPVAGSIYWGYQIQATAHERLAGVEVVNERDGAVRLRLTLQALAGRESVEWLFPATAAAVVRQTAALLIDFVPRQPDRRLRRMGTIAPLSTLVAPSASIRRGSHRRRGYAATETEEQAARATALREALQAFPAPDGAPRQVRAMVAATVPDAREERYLLAVTQAHLLLASGSRQRVPEAYPLTTITSVELRRSALGCHLGWTSGGGIGQSPRRFEVRFSPVALARCVVVFAMLRQLLTLLPHLATGPDIAEIPSTDYAMSDQGWSVSCSIDSDSSLAHAHMVTRS